MIEEMLDEFIEAAPKLAKALAKLRDSLIAEGFSREEALKICGTFKMTGN